MAKKLTREEQEERKKKASEALRRAARIIMKKNNADKSEAPIGTRNDARHRSSDPHATPK